MPNQFGVSNAKAPIAPVAVICGKITVFTRITKSLTGSGLGFTIKSLTKTTSGYPHPKALRFFCACKKVSSRLYDGLRGLNTIPSGNKSRRLVAVSEARHPYLNGVAVSKLKPLGGHAMPKKITPIAVICGKPSLFTRIKLWMMGVSYV